MREHAFRAKLVDAFVTDVLRPEPGDRTRFGPYPREGSNPAEPGKAARMGRTVTASVAASSEVEGADGIRQPAGEVHAWTPGTNQTVCGLQLSRTRLRRFPHVRFDFRSSDVVTPADDVRFICPRCLAATTRRGARSWTRTSPRP